MLIDELMPAYDFSERHATTVHAQMDKVYLALTTADLSASPIARFLLAIRALPARLSGHRQPGASFRPRTLRDAERLGFYIVAENPPAEIVVALQGKFWTPAGGMECASRAALEDPIPPGIARAIWNFSINARDGVCTLTTETRVSCADAAARRRFRIYWFFVRPGSGIIRRMMLRTIRRLAEGAA